MSEKALPFWKLNSVFDADLLKQDLATCQPLSWPNHFNQQDYAGSWKVIALRSPTGAATDGGALSTTGGYHNTEILEQCPYFQSILDSWCCEKESVRLLNLQAGSFIKPHTDQGLSYAAGTIRLHLPIETHPNVEFAIADEQAEMKVGECWYGNFELTHSVRNPGPTDRIHLIADIQTNDWTDEWFQNSGADLEALRFSPTVKRSKAELQAIINALESMGNPDIQPVIENLKNELAEFS